MKQLTAQTLATAGVSFVLNLIWENVQAPLYQGYESFWQHLPLCFIASVVDAMIITSIYLGGALVFRSPDWVSVHTRLRLGLAAGLGAAFAVWIELAALADGRWAYASAMPLIFDNIGLLPILQLTLLTPLTLLLAGRVLKRTYDSR